MTIDYDIIGHDEQTGRLLLAGGGHWLVVDLVPGRPIRMTRADNEAAAWAAFAAS